MDYEKKYKEALKIAKEWHKECESGDNSQRMKKLESMFSELAESEDDRIRKVLLDYFKDYKKQEEISKTLSTFFGIKTDNIIAWLEKRCEQKHIPWYDLQKSKEAGYTIIKTEEFEAMQKPVEWSEEDESIRNGIIDHLREYYVEKKGYPYIADKDSPEMKERIWLESIRPQPKQEWSEDDEAFLDDIICKVESDLILNKDEKNWLKSLRPQKLSNVESNGKNWKPKTFDEACAIVRANPITEEMTYEERLAAQKRRFGL